MEMEKSPAVQPSKYQLALDIEQAKKTPHVEIVPLSENQIIAIIRPELNLEKFSNFIFPHRKAEQLDEVREMEFPVKLENGRQVP